MKFSSSPRPNLTIWFLPIALILTIVASGSAQETPESAVPAATAKKDKAPKKRKAVKKSAKKGPKKIPRNVQKKSARKEGKVGKVKHK